MVREQRNTDMDGAGGFVSVRGVSKTYGGVTALCGIDLEVEDGALTVVLGPSGCGKSTLLRIIAGLTEPDSGTVHLGGRLVNDPRCLVAPERRGLGMVFQDSLLWPHLTVSRNIAFPLGRDPDAGKKVRAAAEAARVERFLKRYPAELSGGERRRVALARAIAREPAMLLLDEPLSGLDAHLRVRLLGTISEIQRSLGVPAIYVTHDQEEALSLADRVVVMREGRVLQAGTAEDVYRGPRTRFVADFVGLSTFVEGEVADGAARCALGEFPVEAGSAGSVLLAVRPESVVESPEGAKGEVVRSSFRGDRWLTELRISDQELLCFTKTRRAAGEEMRVRLDPFPVAVEPDEDAR